MHDNATAKQADDRISTPGIIQAVRGNSDLPARFWGAASAGYCRAPLCSWGRRPADHTGGGVTRGVVGPSDVCPAGCPVLPGPGGGAEPRRYVTPRCPHALASTYPSAAGALRAAHGEAIVASLVDTLAWVTRGRGPYCETPRPPLLPPPSSSWWTPPQRPSGTRWPPAWKGTASKWRLGPQCLRRAWAPFEPRTPGSRLARPRPTMGAATPRPLGGMPLRGRRRVGRHARRGGRALRTGGRPRSTWWIPWATTNTGGTPATTARTCRVGSSHPSPGRVPGS